MRYSFSGLVLLAVLFTPTVAAPVERGDGVAHHRSPHRGLSRRIQAALAKRPPNLTFTPIDSEDDLVHAKYGTSTQLQTSDFRFSATLLKLGREEGIVDAEHLSGRDTQVVVHSADTYGGRHVVISTPDSVVRALRQRGVSQDDMPRYIRQNVHVADPNTGNQYQLVPDGNPEESMSIDSNTITITLSLNSIKG